jgi:hypothetical protein
VGLVVAAELAHLLVLVVHGKPENKLQNKQKKLKMMQRIIYILNRVTELKKEKETIYLFYILELNRLPPIAVVK